MPGTWTIRRTSRPGAALRLYCFPHAGGSAGEYAFWGDDLPSAEVSAIQLPGRGGRFAEAPLTTLAAVRDAVVGAVTFAPPFALFGHSLGAVIAFEVARVLDARGAPPACVVVSAARAPHVASRLEPISHLDDDALIERLLHEPDTALRDVVADPELHELVMPGLRADLQIAERYQFTDGPPLRCPILALGGTADAVTRDELAAWQRHTSAAFSLHMFDGDHYYTRTARGAVLALLDSIAQELRHE